MPSLKAKDRDKAEGDMTLYALSHDMKRVIVDFLLEVMEISGFR